MIRTGFLTVFLCTAPAGAALAGITSCDFSPTGVAFGVFSGSAVRSTGTISFTCFGSGDVPYVMTLSTGSSGVYFTRTMIFGSDRLFYNLFQNRAHTRIWGNGLGGSFPFFGTIHFRRNRPVTTDLTVYGKLPRQNVPSPGTYADTIVVTIIY